MKSMKRRNVWTSAAAALSLLAVLALWAPVVVAHDDALPDEPEVISDSPRLYIGPLRGLTTAWHPAPAEAAVPIGSLVRMRVMLPPGGAVQWRGAVELSGEGGWSVAVCPMIEAGKALIEADVIDHDGTITLACALEVVDLSISEIKYTPIQIQAHSLQIDPELAGDELNQVTMGHYFGEESIAAIRHLGGNRWQTSIDRTVDMSVTVSPAEFAALTEWRIPGAAPRLGSSLSRPFDEPGLKTVSVGPPGGAVTALVSVYQVVITSHEPGDIVPEGVPVTYTAATIPPGLEHGITWLSSTKYGTATPVTGEGPTFTVVFEDTYGPAPDGNGDFQWLGVAADNVRLGQDVKPLCLSGTHLRMDEYAGRALPDIFPNGALYLGDVPLSITGMHTACTPAVVLGGGVTKQRYTVTGNNLQQVSNNIFDAQNGVGPLDEHENRRYAGSAQLSYTFQANVTVSGGNLNVQITDVSWTTNVTLPNWTPPPGTPQAQINEWNRFRMALDTHERGHAAINDTHMAMIETRLENVAAGRVTVPGNNVPQFNQDGTPRTAADAARAMQIDQAVSNAINGHPQMAACDTAQTNYDGMPSQQNPTGTNHGQTQGATLNPNP